MAKPITFTGVKLKLLDDQRKNPTISDLDFRVLHAIIAAIDRQTEEAVRKRETLAREAGYKAVRTVEKSVARWVNRGVISVKRGGGRGNANVYRLVEQRANPGTPFNQSGEAETANRSTPFAAGERANRQTVKGEPGGSERANDGSPPPLYRSHGNSLPRAQARASKQSAAEQAVQSGPSDGRRNEGWWCEARSAEFNAWLEHFTDRGWTRSKQEMLSTAHAGRSVRVPSQWPPTDQRSSSSGIAAVERLRARLNGGLR